MSDQQSSGVTLSARALSPDEQIMSISATPPSFIFPPDNISEHFHLQVPGSRQVAGRNGQLASIVELRGWLRTSGDWGFQPADPDWHYDLELDPAWTDALGIDLRQLLWVGSLYSVTINQIDLGSLYRHAAVPLVHMELNGWRPSAHLGENVPPDWGFENAETGDVKWAYNPKQPLASKPELGWGQDQYVRVVGSLVTDAPHFSRGQPLQFWCVHLGICDSKCTRLAVARHFWSRGLGETDPNNPSRWTEIHPPDAIVVLPDKPQTERVYAIAVGTGLGAEVHEDPQLLSVDLVAPPWTGAALTPRVVVADELPQEVDAATIAEGNAARTGAKIDSFGDHVHVHIMVRVTDGRPGKFSALYRVRWETLEDNKIVRERSAAPVYLLFGQAKFWIPNPTVLASYGGWDRVKVVPDGTLSNVGIAPVDGTLVREQSNPAVYVVFGRAKFWVPSPEEFTALGYSWSSVGVVPDGALGSIASIPVDGTLLQERSGTVIYIVRGGKRYGFTGAQDFEAHGMSWANIRRVPNGSLSGIPDGGLMPTVAMCQQLRSELESLQGELTDLQTELEQAVGSQRLAILRQIRAVNAQITSVQGGLIPCK